MNIRVIRNKTDFIRENQIKRFLDPDVVDNILALDKELKICIHKNDKLKSIKNILSMSFKNAPEIETITVPDDVEQCNFALLTKSQLQTLSKYLSKQINFLDKESKSLLATRDNLISTLGNFLHVDAIISNDENKNGIIYQTDIPEAKKYTHVELCEKLGFVDTINGSAVAGNRGYFLTGMGVKLNIALINYAMDFLNNKAYQLMSTPHIVSKDMMSKITQLSEYDETLYKLEGYDKYLIATSEQPLTAYFAGKILDKKNLPIKFAGLSSCYRKESGRHGTQTRGIYRVHQFEKVEQFCVTDPNESWEMFNKMIKISQEFYDSLGIKYRVVSIVSGALNNAAAMKFDLEGYFCGLKDYGELVSCTNCLDYFSKKIDTTILQSKEHVHMLNCTLMANTRVISCLMEQYQTDSGMTIPKVLQKYIECDFIPFPKI